MLGYIRAIISKLIPMVWVQTILPVTKNTGKRFCVVNQHYLPNLWISGNRSFIMICTAPSRDFLKSYRTFNQFTVNIQTAILWELAANWETFIRSSNLKYRQGITECTTSSILFIDIKQNWSKHVIRKK